MAVEFTSNADDNEHIPDSPIPFLTKKWMKSLSFTHLIKDTLKSNDVRVELIFSAFDSEDAPESPILFQVQWKT